MGSPTWHLLVTVLFEALFSKLTGQNSWIVCYVVYFQAKMFSIQMKFLDKNQRKNSSVLVALFFQQRDVQQKVEPLTRRAVLYGTRK